MVHAYPIDRSYSLVSQWKWFLSLLTIYCHCFPMKCHPPIKGEVVVVIQRDLPFEILF